MRMREAGGSPPFAYRAMQSPRQPMILPAALAPLAAQPRWVVWKWVMGKNGKPTKPPFQGSAPRNFADTTDPTTWRDLEIAMLAYVEGKCDGIGFVLTDS